MNVFKKLIAKCFNLWYVKDNDWRVRGVNFYFGYRGRLGQIGAQHYGLVWHRWPVIAVFVDDSWYEPAVSFGLSILCFDLGVFITIRVLKKETGEEIKEL